ncbi:MAG: SGNH/GDSL hydrolase family protein [Phycisphaerae bacterium]|nr:SGNH/GDSL hydrolase family protein [Phycisphaerae bacterium]
MTSVASHDARLTWSGAVCLKRSDGWVMPCRLPCDDLEMYPPELRDLAAMPSGVRLRFATDAKAVAFETQPMAAAGNLDLYADNVLAGTAAFKQGDTMIHFKNLSPGEKTLELWLNHILPFCLRAIGLPDGAFLDKSQDLRPKWITYGSSITHCGGAGSPSFTWPAIVSRAKNLNLTSLGFGGQCHVDSMIARFIRDLPAQFISLKLGINVHGGSLSPRTFLPAVLGSIVTIRDGHPGIPLVMCSPIWSPERETMPGPTGLTLEMIRADLRHAVEVLRRRGDRNIHYVDGLNLLGPDLAELLPDLVHPDAEGYKRLGENFLHEVFDMLGVEIPSA